MTTLALLISTVIMQIEEINCREHDSEFSKAIVVADNINT
jgi:hypothetical protein